MPIVSKQRKGFALLSRERNREIAANGGRTAHRSGTAHKWTSEEARAAAAKSVEAKRRKKDVREGLRNETVPVEGQDYPSNDDLSCKS